MSLSTMRVPGIKLGLSNLAGVHLPTESSCQGPSFLERVLFPNSASAALEVLMAKGSKHQNENYQQLC